MDNLEYLNQISQSVRPTKPAANSQMKKIIILGIIALFLAITVFAFTAIFSGGRKTPYDYAIQLDLRMQNLSNTLQTYNPMIKSSQLRSLGASLSSTLNNSSTQIANYFTELDLEDEERTPSPSIQDEETLISDNLNATLYNAQLNGLLDRTYLNQITLQISLLLSLETQISSKTNDEELLYIISLSTSNLEVILNNFNNFSDRSS